MNGYGYKVCYKQHGNEKLKLYLVTNTYDSETGIPIQNATWIIQPITTYQEYKRRWRGCPF